MKNKKRNIGLSLLVLMMPFMIFTSCKKKSSDPPPSSEWSCEVVWAGPCYIKVINQTTVKVFVDFRSFMGIGAHLRAQACETYGVPVGSNQVIIVNEATQVQKNVDFTTANGETYVITVDNNFFN